MYTSPDAKNALKTAANGSYPTGEDIKMLSDPYDNTWCTDSATVTITPQKFNVFCNGDGSVDVSTEWKSAVLLYFPMNVMHLNGIVK